MSNPAANSTEPDLDEALVEGFVHQMIDHFKAMTDGEEDEEFTAEAEKYRERRHMARFPFLTVQAVAPRYHGSTPGPRDFRPVECRDLSPSGFAYWADERPDFKDLVARFHMGKDATLITAHVVHVTESSSVGGGRRYLVGCEFMGKIQG